MEAAQGLHGQGIALQQQQHPVWQPHKPYGPTLLQDTDMSPADQKHALPPQQQQQQGPSAAASFGSKAGSAAGVGGAALCGVEPMLLDGADTPVDSSISAGSSMQPNAAAATAATTGQLALQQQQQGVEGAPADQEERYRQLMAQQQRLLQRMQAVSSKLKQQQQQEGVQGMPVQIPPGATLGRQPTAVQRQQQGWPGVGMLRPPLPNRSTATPAAAAAGAGAPAATGSGSGGAAAAATSADEAAGPAPPAGLARGFGSFFLAVPEDLLASNAAPAAATGTTVPSKPEAPLASSLGQQQQQQQQQQQPAADAPVHVSPNPAVSIGEVSPADSHTHTGECSAVVCGTGLLNGVVRRFNTQRVSSPDDVASSQQQHTPAGSTAAAPHSPPAAAVGEQEEEELLGIFGEVLLGQVGGGPRGPQAPKGMGPCAGPMIGPSQLQPVTHLRFDRACRCEHPGPHQQPTATECDSCSPSNPGRSPTGPHNALDPLVQGFCGTPSPDVQQTLPPAAAAAAGEPFAGSSCFLAGAAGLDADALTPTAAAAAAGDMSLSEGQVKGAVGPAGGPDADPGPGQVQPCGGDAEIDMNGLADLFNDDDTDAMTQPPPAVAAAAQAVSSQQQQQLAPHAATTTLQQTAAGTSRHVPLSGPCHMSLVGGTHTVAGSVLSHQAHVGALSAMHGFAPRSNMQLHRPTVTTGALQGHGHSTAQQAGSYSSPIITVSTWNDHSAHLQQQQQQHMPPDAGATSQQQQQQVSGEHPGVSSSSRGFGPEFGVASSSDDPAVTGNTEEDEMLQQVLPQLTAAMEREAQSAAAAAAGGGMGAVSVPAGHHGTKSMTGVHPLMQQQQQQQDHLEQQTGSPFGRMDTQNAICSNLDMPRPQSGNDQYSSLPGTQSGPQPGPVSGPQSGPLGHGQHSLPAPHSGLPSLPTSLSAGHYTMQQQQQQQQQQQGDPSLRQGRLPQGLPRYPSNSGALQQQQQQQQHPAGWGPPSTAGLMQAPLLHHTSTGPQHHPQYQQQQQYQQHYAPHQQHQLYQQQQHQQLPRVHSAPTLPQGNAEPPGMHNAAAAAAGVQPNWGPPGGTMQCMGQGPGYSHLARTSSGGTIPSAAAAAAAAAAARGDTWPLGPGGPLPGGPMGQIMGQGMGQSMGHARLGVDHWARSDAELGQAHDSSVYRGPSPNQGLAAGGVGSSSGLVPGRTITSLKVTYGGTTLVAGPTMAAIDAGAAAAADKPVVKTGTGRPRGRPRKLPLPGAPLPAAASAGATVGGGGSIPSSAAPGGFSKPPQGLLSMQQQQQHAFQHHQQQQQLRVHWQGGYDASSGSDRSASGSSGAGAGLQRKRSGSFSGLDDAGPYLKIKLQRSGSGPISTGGAAVPTTTSSGGSSSNGRTVSPLPKPQKKAKGMTKPTIKDGIMVPPPPGPDMAARGWPPFSDLVVGGYFPPGTYDFSCGTVQSVVATVTPSGLIRWGEETFQSISSFALAVVRTIKPTRQACDGWRECRLKGVKIHEWRAAFLEKRTPPSVPPESVVKS